MPADLLEGSRRRTTVLIADDHAIVSEGLAALLTKQRDVLRLIVKGQRMKEIAANLGLSVRTVESTSTR